MNIGVRAHDFGKLQPDELAKKIAQHGFTSIQLALAKAVEGFDINTQQLSPGYGNRMRRIFDRYGIDIAILGCYINPIHPDPERREILLRRFEEHLRFARDFGCAIVATETGSCNPDNSFSPETQTEDAFLDFVSVITRLAKTAERYGTIIGIEGVSHQHTIYNHERMVRMLALVDSPNVQVVYDPVNFIPAEKCNSHEDNIAEAFELFGDRIVAIHAKDFEMDGNTKIANLPAGKGRLNYHYFLDLLEKRKPEIHVLLENNTPETMDGSIGYLKNILQNI